jgi:hypothetical protein
MHPKSVAVLSLMVAAAVLSAVGSAASVFVLSPLSHGAIARDSGTVSWCCWTRKYVTRDGQTAEINDPHATFTGAKGSFEVRFRIAWLDAGLGYGVGTSTWKFVRGTGAYAGLVGGGRGAQLWIPPDHPASFRALGFLGLRSR